MIFKRRKKRGLAGDLVESADWIAGALQSSGYVADFSSASLHEVERFFDEHAPEGAAAPGGLLDEDLGARLFALGGYVGEVIRRDRGGEWDDEGLSDEEEDAVRLQLPDGTTIWPIQRVMKRFRNGPEDGVVAYAAGLGVDVPPSAS